jgi:predicted phage terminase large subunit-like protein
MEALEYNPEKYRAKSSLLDFSDYVWDSNAEGRFDRAWHTELIAEEMEEFIKHPPKRLIITMPPRHGKSFIASVLTPAFILGRRPNSKIILSSYSDSLATQFSSKTRDEVIGSDEYRELFPHAQCPENESNKRTDEHWQLLGHRGQMYARGIKASITGKGADYLLVDDLIKSAEEADSPTTRDSIWENFNSNLLTRLEYPASALLMMTRWHYDDPVGRLLDQEENDWKLLRLPFLMTDDEMQRKHSKDPRDVGDVLYPAKFRKPHEFIEDRGETPEDVDPSARREPAPVQEETLHERGRKDYERMMENAPRKAAALLQSKPSSEESSFFQMSDFRTYDQPPREVADEADDIILSVDCTFRNSDDSDYVVIQVWAKKGVKFYLLDQRRERLTFTETLEEIHEVANEWPQAHYKVIEGKANGDAVINILKGQHNGIYRYDPTDSKESRARVISCEASLGHVLLPGAHVAPWINSFRGEFEKFPHGPHDDQVDAASQALIFWTSEDNVSNPKQNLKAILGK